MHYLSRLVPIFSMAAVLFQSAFAQSGNFTRNTPAQTSDPAPGTLNVVIGGGADLGSESIHTVLLGALSGSTLRKFQRNVILGTLAASNAPSAEISDNVIIGHAAASAANTMTGIFGGNTLVGSMSGQNLQGSHNTMVGVSSGKAGGMPNQLISRNSFFGAFTGVENIGRYNTYLGAFAGYKNGSGSNNVFAGDNAGVNSIRFDGVSATHSVFVGSESGYFASGQSCVFIGFQAGYGKESSSSGAGNIAIGSSSSMMLAGGTYNTTVGTGSGIDITTGDMNTFIGTSTGLYNREGSYNTYLGYGAHGTGPNAAGLSYATAIGKNALVGVSNGFVLGDTTNTNVGIGTAYPNQRLTIRGNMNFLTASNLRFDNSPFLDINQNRLALGGEKGEFPVEITSSLRYKVATENQWADYVFAPDFRKIPLKDVAAFIQQNGHLPGIPSAKEVIQNGVNAAQMDAKLLAQIEQLTLHAIEQKAENEQLKAENNQLKKSQHMMQIQLDTLLKRIEKLETN
jgi:FtsZ-binding cell division protein ZapB